MSGKNRILAIDAGNTALKVGLFKNGQLIETNRFMLSELEQLYRLIESSEYPEVVISSVLSEGDTERIINLTGSKTLIVDHSVKLPVQLKYKTPETLGIDRICNAAAVFRSMKSEYGLSIDIGTCIKFDLVKNNGDYLGGSISPGIDLRFKSLNDYTANLPLLSDKSGVSLTGNSTDTAIRSGVINGAFNEISGMMQRYSEHYSDLTFFVTGGDSIYFDLQSKNNIFADENLTLKGLYEIYQANN